MTPKEKAIDLFVKYYERLPNDTYSNEGAKTEAKECALIAVNEMLEELDHLAFDDFDYGTSKMMYWQEVKEEIFKITMEKVIRDGHVAVIISNGYGAGWSTWHDGPNRETLAFHPKLVELIESEQHNKDNMSTLLVELLGEEEAKGIYLGGVEDLTIQWLPEGTRFRIEEYDGKEYIITNLSLDMTA